MTRLNYQQGRDEYLNVRREHIEMTTGSTESHLPVKMDMVGLAAVNATSLHIACESLGDAPTSAAVLYQLRQGWLNERALADVEDELNGPVVARLPGRVRGCPHTVATT